MVRSLQHICLSAFTIRNKLFLNFRRNIPSEKGAEILIFIIQHKAAIVDIFAIIIIRWIQTLDSKSFRAIPLIHHIFFPCSQYITGLHITHPNSILLSQFCQPVCLLILFLCLRQNQRSNSIPTLHHFNQTRNMIFIRVTDKPIIHLSDCLRFQKR